MDTDRTRYTHPDPEQIGRSFVGDLGGAPSGRLFTQEYVGTLGPSERAVVPVVDDGDVVALVAVGITVDRLDRQLLRDLPGIALAAGATLLAGLLGAWLIARRLRRQTHGLGEREITRMYEYYRAVLGAVREGLLLVDDDLRVQLVNQEAVRLLALPDDVEGRSLDDLGLPPGLVAAVERRTALADQTYVLGQQVLVFSSAPAYWREAEVGAVVTVRDRTELQAVTGELDLVRGLTESLRAQNHEAANRLHTIVSLVEMGRTDQAVAFATAELEVAQGLTDELVSAVDEPVLAALLLGKTAQAAERGIDLEIAGGLPADLPVGPRDLVTLVGNLVDNAFDAVALTRATSPQRVRVELAGDAEHLTVAVDDSGPGIAPDDRLHVLERGWSSKAQEGRGLGLAIVAQVVSQHGGTLDVTGSPLGGARFAVGVRRRGGRPGDRWPRMSVRVLVVEDEEVAADAHATYVGRLAGFELAGVARSAGEAVRLLNADPSVDLILLDMHLPDGHGLGLLQRLRAEGRQVDVIAVTSARDTEVVRRAVSQGVVLYLLKPFTFATFRGKLEQYAEFRSRLERAARRRGAGRRRPALRRPARPADGRHPAQGNGARLAARGRRGAAPAARGPLRGGGRRRRRRLPRHGAALPRAPRRRGSGHPLAALRRRRPSGGRLRVGRRGHRGGRRPDRSGQLRTSPG